MSEGIAECTLGGIYIGRTTELKHMGETSRCFTNGPKECGGNTYGLPSAILNLLLMSLLWRADGEHY